METGDRVVKVKSRASEERLLEIRSQAASASLQAVTPGVPKAPEAGYYGLPVLKEPQWSWEVPAYLFTGGAAGAAALIAGAAGIGGTNPRLLRDARRLATVCGTISPLLLISDLGKPSRFLNMLRVFKVQSPMSVGSWTLLVFSNAAVASALFGRLRPDGSTALGSAAQAVSSLTGLALTTYTGVLLGVTAIPVWAENSVLLPFHFGASGLASAVAILQLAGHENDRGLHALGIASAAAETVVGARIELKSNPATRPLKSGASGWLTRAGGLLSGPLPLALRLLAGRRQDGRSVWLRRAAAVSAVAGSVLTRFAWVEAGKASARDPKPVLETPDDQQPKPVGRSRAQARLKAADVSTS